MSFYTYSVFLKKILEVRAKFHFPRRPSPIGRCVFFVLFRPIHPEWVDKTNRRKWPFVILVESYLVSFNPISFSIKEKKRRNGRTERKEKLDYHSFLFVCSFSYTLDWARTEPAKVVWSQQPSHRSPAAARTRSRMDSRPARRPRTRS